MSEPDTVDGLDAADQLLTEAKVIVMAGPGGVGKTTVGAALGLRAAQKHGRRVVVVTVDPARRLAEALGVARLTEEPVLVPVGSGGGRLWVLMVDMAKSWDELVTSQAPNPEVSQALLDNALYRTLTRRFVQSHDYIALDHLVTLADHDRYDLVIVDTPPSGHALDLLDAPGRMIDFFESRLLRWLTVSAGSSITNLAARPFLAVAERLLGGDFLTQITEFFTLFAQLRPAFVSRAKAVEQRLSDGDTNFAVVTTTDPTVVAGTQDLVDELERRDLAPGLFVINRLPPTLRLANEGDGTVLEHSLDGVDVASVESSELAEAIGQLVTQAESAVLPTSSEGCPVVPVPWSAQDLTDLDRLAELFDGPG